MGIRPKVPFYLGSDVLCAETFQSTKSSCPDDSGGPLLQSANGHFTQIGIVSWGFACRPFNRDNEANVDGYADVSDAYPWIQSIIK